MVRRMRKILTNQQEPGETAYREDALQMWRRYVESIWINIVACINDWMARECELAIEKSSGR